MHEPQNGEVSWSQVARAAAGDPAARSVFCRGYLPVVRSFLRSRWHGTRLADDIDDAVQEVFVECLRGGGALSGADPERGELQGLLFGVTRKVAARFEDRLRGRYPLDRATESTLQAIQAREPSLSMLFDREWARTYLRLTGERMRAGAVRGSPGARLRVELLRLRFTEGLPIREIAARWGADPDSVHRAYGKAREEFKLCLRQVVAEHVVRSEADLDREVARVFELLG